MPDTFTPGAALLGGALIGLASILLLLLDGRIAGVSGIVGGLLPPIADDLRWRLAFVIGLLAGGGILRIALPGAFERMDAVPLGVVLLAGLLVGIGTQLGSGCTSGHGVCGIGRGSPRSVVATITFMATGFLTVALVRHVLGGP